MAETLGLNGVVRLADTGTTLTSSHNMLHVTSFSIDSKQFLLWQVGQSILVSIIIPSLTLEVLFLEVLFYHQPSLI